jgi:phosphate transport system substrate-binding protein
MRVKRPLVFLLLTLSLVVSACGSDSDPAPATDDEAAADTAPDDDEGDAADDGGDALTGEVIISGSSTVEPISARNAENWSPDNPDVAISVDGPGTGDGFEIFCNGESQISDASRPIQPEEIETCEANGIEFIELKVAIDGLSIITSTENDQVTCLSFADAYALLGPESTGFTNWSDADDLAAELAGGDYGEIHAPYPDAELVVSAPGEESGTFDSFVEIVLEHLAEERGQEAEPRPDYQASPNDNVIVEAISGTPTALGWVGYAFVQANPDAVQALEVDGGDGCVAPTPETIADGSFPIARPLFIYVSVPALADNAALESYVDFYLSDEGFAAVSEVGYVDLADDEIENTRQVWEDRETGTREG